MRIDGNGDHVSIRFDHLRDAWSWLQAGLPPDASPRSTRARLAGLDALFRRAGLRLDVYLRARRLASLGENGNGGVLERLAGLGQVEVRLATLLRGLMARDTGENGNE
jgi:hypothetical protein